ncbi:MAG: hypothetical protein M1480_09300 [Bacteroidetes bacterium]|nr:hypothetical protein [Bacteroidota bacterium]
MADLTKYEILISELSSIEAQLSNLIHKNQELVEQNSELQSQLIQLKNENTYLTQKLSSLEKETNSQNNEGEINLFNSLNLKERENLKVRLQNLISKIDYHLSAV